MTFSRNVVTIRCLVLVPQGQKWFLDLSVILYRFSNYILLYFSESNCLRLLIFLAELQF